MHRMITPRTHPLTCALIAVGVLASTAVLAPTTVAQTDKPPMVTQTDKRSSPPSATAPDLRERRIDLQAFNSIEFLGPVDVELVQTGQHGAIVLGHTKDVNRVKFDVEGSLLRVTHPRSEERWWQGLWRDSKPMRVVLQVAELTSIKLTGSGDVTSQSLKAEELAVHLAGSGDVRLLGLAAQRLTISIAGSGDVVAKGSAANQRLSIAGSGDLNTKDLAGERVTVSIAGSGDAEVWAQQTLSISIAGAGTVRYRGEPKVSQTVVGAGTIERINP
jgi:hypothetical protein